jgi:hypothetical protein
LGRLVTALSGHPLRLRQAAALVRTGDWSFAALADRTARDPSILDRLSIDALDDRHRRVLTTLAFLAGALLPMDLVASISDVGVISDSLVELSRRGLTEQHHDRFGLPICIGERYQELLLDYFDLAGAARELGRWLSRQDPTSDTTLSAVNAVISLIGFAAKRRGWTTIVTLVRAAEPILTLAGRWEASLHLLRLGIEASKTIGDAISEALFTHQQGTLAVCRRETELARQHLSHALELRRQLRDHNGAAVTDHNLRMIGVPLPVQPSQPPVKRAHRRLLAVVVGVVITGLTLVTAALARPVVFSTPNSLSPNTAGPPPPPPAVRSPPPKPGPGTRSTDTQPAATLPPHLTPDRGDFAVVHVNPTGPDPTVTFTVSNPNGQPITVARPQVSGDSAFAVRTEDCAQTKLAAAERCQVIVAFHPTQRGQHTATLAVSDTNGLSASAAINGAGLVVLAIRINGTIPNPGAVSDEAHGITCRIDTSRGTCNPFNISTSDAITLTATPTVTVTPNPGLGSNFFTYWSDGCTGKDRLTCHPDLTDDNIVTANFASGPG